LLRDDVVRVFVSFCVSFCTGHFVMVPLNLTNLHCLQHYLSEHLFNLYLISQMMSVKITIHSINYSKEHSSSKSIDKALLLVTLVAISRMFKRPFGAIRLFAFLFIFHRFQLYKFSVDYFSKIFLVYIHVLSFFSSKSRIWPYGEPELCQWCGVRKLLNVFMVEV